MSAAVELGISTTQAILAQRSADYHLMKDPGNPRISTVSYWEDPVWHIDNLTAGASLSQSSFRWDFVLPDGTSFMAPVWSALRDVFRRFMWSLLRDRRGGADALKPGSVGAVSAGIRMLVCWMVRQSHDGIASLNSDASWDFVEDLVAQLTTTEESDDEEEDGLSFSQVDRYIKIWTLIFRQSAIFREVSIEPMPEAPFNGTSPTIVARSVTTRVASQIPEIPDEVSIPVMNAMHSFLDVPAEDIIRAIDLYRSAYDRAPGDHGNGPGTTSSARKRRARKALMQFKFSVLPNSATPWRPPLTPVRTETLAADEVTLDIVLVLRNLVRDVIGAASGVIQSETGQRLSEVCAIGAGIDPDTELPLCVKIEQSPDHLLEIFYIESLLAKTEPVPIERRWVAGARPVGSTELPGPVRAIIVVDRLLSSWREMARPDLRTALFLSFTAGRGLPKDGSSIGRVRADALRNAQKDFIRKYVDLTHLPDQNARGDTLKEYRVSNGTCLRTLQWRVTYARFVFATDDRLLDAVCQQFQHLSRATTAGYVGRDPMFQAAHDGVRARRTAQFFYEWSRGERPIYGRFAEFIEERGQDIKRLTEGKERRDALRALNAFVVEHDLRIWFTPHNKCFIGINPSGARCHDIAGTSHWSNLEPNHATKEPSVCAGCACGAIDGEHAPFWLRRYVDNQAAWLKAQSTGHERQFTVLRARAEQSAAVLRALGIPLPELTLSGNEHVT